MNALTRFEAKVDPAADPETGCLLWVGAMTPSGYGRFYFEGRLWVASRWIYTHHHGPIPEGLVVRHTCDNPSCVNLSHLILGTQDDNLQDMRDRGRYRNGHGEKAHCIRGHPLSGNNIYEYGDGRRHCKKCRRVRRREKSKVNPIKE